MIWLLLYVPAFVLLWRIMEWDSKGRTLLSFAVLLFYACALATVGPLYFFVKMFSEAPKCTCVMVKNHECVK